jgi:glycosyltransferase involved in cell wall biosynthesis
MKIALVVSSYLPNRGGLERHVHELAHGLARRGAEVEVLAQGPVRSARRVAESDGVIVRCFPSVVGPMRFATAPGLWDRLRLVAADFDLADVQSADARLALAAIRGGFRRCVFTPHASMRRLVS